MEQSIQTSNLRDLLAILFKHKHKIVITFLATVVTVTIGVSLRPHVYEAKSSLMVKPGREYVYRPEVGEGNQDWRSLISPSQEEVINSEIQILTSRDLTEKVVTALKVETLYPDLDKNPPKTSTPLNAAVQLFEKNLSVEGIKKSNVILISFKHENPLLAAKAVNLLAEFLKEKHLQVYSDPKSSFLEQQFLSYEQSLKGSQNRLEAFKQKNRVFSLEEQRTLLLRQRTELDTSLKNSENQVKELQKKLSSLKEQMSSISENVQLSTETERHRIIDDAKANLLALQLKEQGLLEKYRENNQLVVSVRKEMQIVQDFIKKQEEDLKGKVTTGKNIVYLDMEREKMRTQADLSSQEAKYVALREQVAQIDREIQTLDLKENELGDLKRNLAANEKNYQTYSERAEEARISEALNLLKMANISVIQAATVPTQPVGPRRLLIVAMGAILGAVAGLGLAYFSEYASQGLSTPESAEKRLGLPVLASVSYKKQ